MISAGELFLVTEAEQRRRFDSFAVSPQEKARHASLFFDVLLYQKVRQFNPLYAETPGTFIGEIHRLSASIHGNREMLTYLRNKGKFLCC